MLYKSSLGQHNNKKGAVLAIVIIIGAALFILVGMAALLANNTISVADDSVKTRQAYLNAKSGIEFAKVMMDQQIQDTTNLLNASPAAVESLPDTQILYGYGYPETGFTLGENPDAPIQIICNVTNEKNPVESTTPGVIEYNYNMHINAIAEAKLNLSNSTSEASDKIILKYEDVEPLKGAVILGDGTISDDVIPENTEFDANISGDLRPYFYNNSLDSFYVGSSSSSHSIVFTKPVTEYHNPNYTNITANKMYFLGSPASLDFTLNNNEDITLSANYLYFKGNLNFVFNRNCKRNQFYITPYIGNSCIVLFDNVTLTVTTRFGNTTTKYLNGFYKFNWTNNDNLYYMVNDILTFPNYESMKITDSTDIANALAKFDPYIISNNFSASSFPVTSAVRNEWTNNPSYFDDYEMQITNISKPNDLVLLFAESVDSGKTINYTGKQIRFVASSRNYPIDFDDGFTVSSNTKLTFNTSLLSYYGNTIRKGNSNSSLTLNALNGGEIASIYLPIITNIGVNTFTEGYYILPSGENILNSVLSNAVDGFNLFPQYYNTGTLSLNGGADKILNVQSIVGNPELVAQDVKCININATKIIFNGLLFDTPSLRLESMLGDSLYFFFAQDTSIEQTDGTFADVEAGFYKINGSSGQVTAVDLTSMPNLIKIPPIFSFPGQEGQQGSEGSSFTLTPTSIGGIYR